MVNPQNIWIMNDLTRDVVRRGTGARAYRELKRDDLSGKTGTTNEQRDAWFAGFNPSMVAVAWMGFDDFSPMGQGETGSRSCLVDMDRIYARRPEGYAGYPGGATG